MLFKIPVSIAINSMRKGDEKFNNSHKSFGDFNVKKDLSYIVDGEQAHKLDIYTPVKNSNGITIVYIHGGAYVYGWKEVHRIFVSWFVNQGFNVVCMNYRLANLEGNIGVPEQISDVFAALNFIAQNDIIYGICKDKLCLLGDSSGGHLALMSDIIFHSKEAQEYYGIDKLPVVKIHAVALNSPMYDFVDVVKLGRSLLTKKNCKRLFSSRYKDKEFVIKNSPRYYVNKKIELEPVFANSSAKDFYKKQTLILKDDFDKLGYNLDYIFEYSHDKKVGHVYNHFLVDEAEGLKCNKAIVDFYLRNTIVD